MTNPFAMTDPVPPAAPAAPVTPTPAPIAAPAAQPVQPAAAPAAPTYPADADPFANSDPAPQAARAPRFRELYGRLIILVPKKLELGVASGRFKNPDGSPTTQDRMTADIIVCDGPTIHYGGEPEKIPPIPHTKTAEVPVKFADAYLSFAGIISQCRDALAARQAGRPGMVIGRLTKGTDDSKGNPPWLLTPATDADKALGRQALAAVTADPFA